MGYFNKQWMFKAVKRISVAIGRISFYLILPIGFIFSTIQLLDWYDFLPGAEIVKEEKIRGMHFFARVAEADSGLVQLARANVKWVAKVPYGVQDTHTDAKIIYEKPDSTEQWSSGDSTFMKLHLKARENGFKSILKPHLWMMDADKENLRNGIDFETESEWKQWEDNYREFILHYAQVAQSVDMEMLCIGLELQSTVLAREAFWRELIPDIRSIYSGKLTYGANWWEEYKAVPFWDLLDYIGIQAYFPLANNNNPSVEELKAGWQKYIPDLERIAEQWNKPILFTEIGYRNTADTAIEPWAWPENLEKESMKVSSETQSKCYQAFFESVWDQPWFSGAIFWEWKMGFDNQPMRRTVSFSPQERPAEDVLKEWFGK